MEKHWPGLLKRKGREQHAENKFAPSSGSSPIFSCKKDRNIPFLLDIREHRLTQLLNSATVGWLPVPDLP